jgi:uncharacterized protein (DUF1697 family)
LHCFAGVETVVASGNVLFDHPGEQHSRLAERIEAVVKRAFGFDSFVAVRTRAELASAVEGNPFADDGEARFVHTIFLERSFDREAFDAFVEGYEGPERLAADDQAMYIDYAEGVGRSKLDPAMRKARIIGGRATARNIRSLRRILETMDT